ncbi:hypothetical protein HanRHA438_Chr13g0603681 [Helianthus annuus]|uniref:Uncharacterized protein n=1 Tax=Helianthus annuus TaxID=4232 RepID=A0A251SUG5_HELAN|nr:hypothetical protein HanXRQr2_Chr13g0593061 [Helianthus annuus]KAJ0498097.1 hypothetical protein HanHA89_Chr13g0518551 [Helianthus annuus]KAJ0617151.1 hypothetical protein HanIR_Chr02g0098281 [Helianthus annuus]KAJ0858674.1 hypothetical protein HanRHA438_Chr13g0603681 [Helianthus annuus]
MWVYHHPMQHLMMVHYLVLVLLLIITTTTALLEGPPIDRCNFPPHPLILLAPSLVMNWMPRGRKMAYIYTT